MKDFSQRQHPLHHHILTFLTGAEINIDSFIPVPESRPAQRRRTYVTDVERTFTVAPWLDQAHEQEYSAQISSMLAKKNIRGGYSLGRLKGCQFYGSTLRNGSGRNCMQGKHHDSNNFYVELQRNGNVNFHCFASDCCKSNTVIGKWITSLDQMLADNQLWQPGPTVDAALLSNTMHLATKQTPKKEQLSEQPFYDRLTDRVCEYLAHYFVFVTSSVLYVKQKLDEHLKVCDYERFSDKQLGPIVRPYKSAFYIFDSSWQRDQFATKSRFVGQPWDERTKPDEYNLCAGLMPLLAEPARQLDTEELAQIQPILNHIKDSICSSNETDYKHLLAWISHVCQFPERKVGWCPVLISTPGAGKSIILGSLLCGIFQELGVHVTNFSSVVNR